MIEKERTKVLTILHHGGGVQTGTMIEMIYDGLLPKPNAVISADTGDEPSYVYDQLARDKELMKSINVPFITVKNGNLHDDLYAGGRFAAMPLFTQQREDIRGFGKQAKIKKNGKLRRQCTKEYKIVPIEREIRAMLLEMNHAKQSRNGAIRINKDVFVESWIGYTTDEIERVNRMYQAKWQMFKYPLIEMRMTKQECIKWLEENNKPARLSSACKKCPLLGNRERRQIRDNDPKGWEETLQFDDDLRNGDLRITATAKGELFMSDKFIPLRELNIDEDNSQMSIFCSHVGCMT
jgi:hypothetical protein